LAGLQDRSSRPHRLHRPTPQVVVEEIERLRGRGGRASRSPWRQASRQPPSAVFCAGEQVEHSESWSARSFRTLARRNLRDCLLGICRAALTPKLGSALLLFLSSAHAHRCAATGTDLAGIAPHACGELLRIGHRRGAEPLGVAATRRPLRRRELRRSWFWRK
jgi:hypothetical protein